MSNANSKIVFINYLKKIALLSILIGFQNISAQESPYFQQKVNYQISVSLDDNKNLLNAFETINYTNNSNDTLKEIYFHLWPNAYKNNKTAFAKEQILQGYNEFYYSSDSSKGYIDSLNFKINNEDVDFSLLENQIDICIIHLKKPLFPNKTIEISTPFRVKIPSKIFSRFGRENDMFAITQWYPKPAVYDKKGWNYFSYTDQSEFYSEFGSYNVTISLPEKYIIASTGILSNETTDNGIKTQNYQLDSIHDFAWFANPNFIFFSKNIQLSGSNKTIKIQAFKIKNTNTESSDNTLENIEKTLNFYSENVGSYPYPVATVVEASESYGGGMEYPTICFITFGGDEKGNENLIAHEVGHNWFYGILASNEHINPWMDEGINSFYDSQYNAKYNNKNTLYIGNIARILGIQSPFLDKLERQSMYLFLSNLHLDQEANLPANNYNTTNYMGIVYEKVASSFLYLKAYLGDSVFNNCMHAYYKEWAFKHPQPNDIKLVFERESKKDLTWFFSDLLGSTKQTDYAIKSAIIQKEANIAILKIKNKGSFTGPFSISSYQDNILLSKQWFNGFNTKKYTIGIPFNNANRFVLDSDFETFDKNRKNNVCNLKKESNLRLKFLTGIDCFETKELYFAPIIGWNLYDHGMFGMALYNKNILPKKTEFFIAPLYSFSTSTLNGLGTFTQTCYKPVAFLQRIKFDLNTEKFTYSNYKSNLHYTKILPRLTMDFKKKNFLQIHSHQIMLKYYRIYQEYISYSTNRNYQKDNIINQFGVATYTFDNQKTINPNKIISNIEFNKSFSKLYAEFFQKIEYSEKKSLDLRVFAGGFLWQKTEYYGNYNFRMSGQTGYQDYLFDTPNFARTEVEGILSQQAILNDGGFKTFTYIGQTNKWLATINLESDIPGILPLRIFADLGTYERADKQFTGSQLIPFDAGISIQLFAKTLKIYIPIFYSSDIKQVNDLIKRNFGQQIRFVIDFEKFNVWKLRETVLN